MLIAYKQTQPSDISNFSKNELHVAQESFAVSSHDTAYLQKEKHVMKRIQKALGATFPTQSSYTYKWLDLTC